MFDDCLIFENIELRRFTIRSVVGRDFLPVFIRTHLILVSHTYKLVVKMGRNRKPLPTLSREGA